MSGMRGISFLERCLAHVPAQTDVLVDVSNMSPAQLARAHDAYELPLYVSTHKSFNAKRDVRFPSSPASWLVLRPPLDGAEETRRAAFDAARQEFVKRRSASPVRVRYRTHSKPSSCSIVTASHASSFEHANCEIDDDVLAFLAFELDLPVLTNDRSLGRQVERSRPPVISADMGRLMKYTHLTLLRRDAGRGWAEVGRHRAVGKKKVSPK